MSDIKAERTTKGEQGISTPREQTQRTNEKGKNPQNSSGESPMRATDEGRSVIRTRGRVGSEGGGRGGGGGGEGEPSVVVERTRLARVWKDLVVQVRLKMSIKSRVGLRLVSSFESENLLNSLLVHALDSSRPGSQPEISIEGHQDDLGLALLVLLGDVVVDSKDPSPIDEVLLLERASSKDEIVHVPRSFRVVRVGERERDVLRSDGEVGEVVSPRGLDLERSRVGSDVGGEVGESFGSFGSEGSWLVRETVEFGDDWQGNHDGPLRGLDGGGEESEGGEEDVGVEDEDGVSCENRREVSSGGGGSRSSRSSSCRESGEGGRERLGWSRSTRSNSAGLEDRSKVSSLSLREKETKGQNETRRVTKMNGKGFKTHLQLPQIRIVFSIIITVLLVVSSIQSTLRIRPLSSRVLLPPQLRLRLLPGLHPLPLPPNHLRVQRLSVHDLDLSSVEIDSESRNMSNEDSQRPRDSFPSSSGQVLSVCVVGFSIDDSFLESLLDVGSFRFELKNVHLRSDDLSGSRTFLTRTWSIRLRFLFPKSSFEDLPSDPLHSSQAPILGKRSSSSEFRGDFDSNVDLPGDGVEEADESGPGDGAFDESESGGLFDDGGEEGEEDGDVRVEDGVVESILSDRVGEAEGEDGEGEAKSVSEREREGFLVLG